jgi:hypothetical protein
LFPPTSGTKCVCEAIRPHERRTRGRNEDWGVRDGNIRSNRIRMYSERTNMFHRAHYHDGIIILPVVTRSICHAPHRSQQKKQRPCYLEHDGVALRMPATAQHRIVQCLWIFSLPTRNGASSHLWRVCGINDFGTRDWHCEWVRTVLYTGSICPSRSLVRVPCPFLSRKGNGIFRIRIKATKDSDNDSGSMGFKDTTPTQHQ